MDTKSLADAMRDWREYAMLRRRLRERNYVRSFRDPQADFAEWLVARVVQGEIVDNRVYPGYDVVKDERRIQVKKWGRENNPWLPTRTGEGANRATEYAYVFYEDGIPRTIYFCAYDWVVENRSEKSGLDRKQVMEVAQRGDPEVEARDLTPFLLGTQTDGGPADGDCRA